MNDRVNILLVDDHPPNLVALEAILGSLGENMVRATSGREALRHLLRQSFAVILLDVQMPQMDGFETASLIRARESSRHTPIIFVTAADPSDDLASRGYALGAVDYIFKPIVPETLRAKVSVFIELYRTSREVQKLYDNLQARTAELEAANRELRAFSYSVSHDLRAPLRRIDQFSRVLLEDHREGLAEEGRECLDRIRRSSLQMSGLIDDLLTLSLVTRSDLHLESVDLSALAREIVADLAAGEPDRDVRVDIESIDAVRCDPRLLRLALRNLLGNAWKYTGQQPDAHIVFGRRRGSRGGGETFFVRDNGAGFDMSASDRLFAPFERLHSTNEFPGTGVGLAIVQRVVERHGGTIWAESEPGDGATFHFTLGT